MRMQPPMPEPLAYFLTWTTYGTWLPGDARGWVPDGGGDIRPPDPEREVAARRRMTEPPVKLSQDQRRIVCETIAEHCRVRSWCLHAVNARTNHVHVSCRPQMFTRTKSAISSKHGVLDTSKRTHVRNAKTGGRRAAA